MGEVPVSEQISQEVMALLGTERQVEPFSRRYQNFELAEAYDVVARVGSLRRGRGEKSIGRKIGFTIGQYGAISALRPRSGTTFLTGQSAMS